MRHTDMKQKFSRENFSQFVIGLSFLEHESVLLNKEGDYRYKSLSAPQRVKNPLAWWRRVSTVVRIRVATERVEKIGVFTF